MRNFLNETNDLHWLLVGVYKNTAYFCSFKFFCPTKGNATAYNLSKERVARNWEKIN